MEEQKVIAISQILEAMRQATIKLEKARNRGNMEELSSAKKELLSLKKSLEEQL